MIGGRAGLLAAAALTMGLGAAVSTPPTPSQPTSVSEPGAERAKPANQNPVHSASKNAAIRSAMRAWRRGPSAWPGYGWPVAHDRRMARKARNQKRNRRAHRG